MKPFRAREFLLLTAPLVLLGGGAWIKWQGLFGQFPERLQSGEPRLVTSEVRPLPLSAFDVGSGINWAAQVTLFQAGNLPPGLPATAKQFNFGNSYLPPSVYFERDGKWLLAPALPARKSRAVISTSEVKNYDSFHLRHILKLQLSLDGLEKARQIRVKGSWLASNFYQKADCAGVQNGGLWEKHGISCTYNLTAPFDILVKGPDDAFPQPQVEKKPQFEVLDGALIDVLPGQPSVYLRAKCLFSFSERDDVRAWIQKPILKDARGKEIDWQVNLPGGGLGIPFQGGSLDDGLVSKILPADQILVSITSWGVAPKGGWAKVPTPLTLQGEITDGENWPQPFKIEIPRFSKPLREFSGNTTPVKGKQSGPIRASNFSPTSQTES